MSEAASTPQSGDEMARVQAWLVQVERRTARQQATDKLVLSAVRRLLRKDAFRSPKAVRAVARDLRRKARSDQVDDQVVEGLASRLERWADRLPAVSLDGFLRGLQAACEARGLEARVVRREPDLVLRVPPFAVAPDVAKGRARLLFAEDALATVPLEAGAVLAARDRLVEELERGFDPAAFFRDCRLAYLQALAAHSDRRDGDRVELREFLPLLALRRQGQRFARSLEPRRWRPYTRGVFAYHVLLLQRGPGFSLDGLRMELSAATGTTGFQKSRSILMENEHGQGERKLTIYFRSHANA